MPKPKDENRDLNALILHSITQWVRQMKPGQCIEIMGGEAQLERLANLDDGNTVYVAWQQGSYTNKHLDADEAAIWLHEKQIRAIQ